MRLIDADALIEAIKNMSQRYCDCKDCDGRGQIIRVSEVIDIAKNEVPTAYSVDKVVDELEEWSFEAKILVPNNNELGEYEEEVQRKIICTQNAIEIVKQGGMADYVCEWKMTDTKKLMPYKASCGNEDLYDNSYKYCPYCGKKIKVVE